MPLSIPEHSHNNDSVIGYNGKLMQNGFSRINQMKQQNLLENRELQDNRRHVLFDGSTENSMLLFALCSQSYSKPIILRLLTVISDMKGMWTSL